MVNVFYFRLMIQRLFCFIYGYSLQTSAAKMMTYVLINMQLKSLENKKNHCLGLRRGIWYRLSDIDWILELKRTTDIC